MYTVCINTELQGEADKFLQVNVNISYLSEVQGNTTIYTMYILHVLY